MKQKSLLTSESIYIFCGAFDYQMSSTYIIEKYLNDKFNYLSPPNMDLHKIK